MPDSAAVAKALATPGTKRVTITPGPNKDKDVPTVDQHPCRVSKKKESGQIVWALKDNDTRPFRVIFTGPSGSPFAKHEFSETYPISGPVRDDVPHGTTHYKYVVSVDGGPALDPDVIVDP